VGKTVANVRATSVLVVDENPLFGQSLAYALGLQGVSCSWCDHALTESQRQVASVVVAVLPLAESVSESCLVEASRTSGSRVLLVSRVRDGDVNGVPAGVEAVFDRSQSFDDLVRELYDFIVHDGRRASHAHLPWRQRAPIAGVEGRHQRLDALSRREREVLRALMDGLTADEIARGTGLSIATVRSHVHGVLTKLGVNGQLAAVAAAHRAGWTGG
jgi:DNA-binding NarL/FixJ family response regulator